MPQGLGTITVKSYSLHGCLRRNQNKNTGKRTLCYINTNEIPSELSRTLFAQKYIFTCEDNMLFSHVKRSLLLWLHLKITPFDAFREWFSVSSFGFIINRILHGRLEIRKFFFLCRKIFHSFTMLKREIFFNTLREISSLHGHVISSIY